jgi:tRNA(Ile2) C34 agmatinyltransferase TiaS
MLTKQAIIEMLKTRDAAIARALVALTARQTADEKVEETVKHQNGEGYRPCHARMGTSMSQFYEKNGYLSQKQIAYWRHLDKNGKMRIEIYANQLLAVAQAKADTI